MTEKGNNQGGKNKKRVIVAITNQKGGVGKTTTTVNLAAALGRAGKQVLLVDLDPQASLTEYFISPANLTETVYDLLKTSKTITPIRLGEYISLLPTNIDLSAAEIELPTQLNQERTLARKLRAYEFDYCLVDCLPSLGVLNRNALTAATLALIPVTTEIMAERTIKLMLDSVERVQESELNPGLRIWYILPTLYDGRLSHHKEILAALKAKYGRLVYEEPVKATTKYKDAVTSKVDISELDAAQGEYWDRLAAQLIADAEEKEEESATGEGTK
ncbi:MAG: ParA family protein [Chloroflexi bacterium]|nr:ParA family protein [Chloroflexota bacterium]